MVKLLLAKHSNNLLFCDKRVSIVFVHSSRIKKQLEYLTSLGVDIAPWYKQSGISKDEEFGYEKTFDFELYKSVLEFALRQTNNPHYGLEFGSQPQIGGTIGMMCASCKNLKEAFVQGCKFLKLQGDFADLSFIDDTHSPRLVYKLLESWSIISPYTAKLEVDAMFSFLTTISKLNSNNAVKPKQIRLAFAKPDDLSKYETIFGLTPVFGTEENEIVYDRSDLLIPMKAFNPETYHLLNTYLQSQLSQVYGTETVSEKVKRILHSSFKYQFPDIDTVAEKLNLSSRTLQRKLSDEKTSFKNLLLSAKLGIAKELIQQNMLTISEISYTLGYSDIGNFSRTFKKHVGISPLEFREQ